MKHILALDDNKTILNVISLYLSEHGFIVHKAQNSKEMWRITETYSIDLFLLDLHLAGESGLDVVKEFFRGLFKGHFAHDIVATNNKWTKSESNVV